MIKDLIHWSCFFISVGCFLLIIANIWPKKEYAGKHRAKEV